MLARLAVESCVSWLAEHTFHFHNLKSHCRHLRKYLNEDIVKDLVGDANAIAELEKEWDQLVEDRLALRQIFPSGDSKVRCYSKLCQRYC
jgi:RNA polymerase Rpb1, domain 6